jgi:integrase
MRGHIRRRGKGWAVVVNTGKDLSTGKYKQQWLSVKGNKKDAEKRLAEVLHQLDSGTFMKPGKATLGDYLEQWLSDYCYPNLRRKTFYGYRDIVQNRLAPSLGSTKLTEVKPESIQKLYARWLENGRVDGEGGLSPRTVQRYHQCLHRALKTAVEWGLLQRNPADAVRPPKVQSKDMQVLDEDGIRATLDAASSTPYYPLFYLALTTGMRRSELLALRWCDVELNLGQVSVKRTLQQLRDGTMVFYAPKTAKGSRTVALPPSACLMLGNHKARQEEACTIFGVRPDETNLIFCHEVDGSPLHPDAVTKAWIRLARRTGFSNIRFHDLRHTHASIMLKHGIHPKIVQERLGHASISITLDTYSHVAPGLQAAAAAKFDEGLRLELRNGGDTQPISRLLAEGGNR